MERTVINKLISEIAEGNDAAMEELYNGIGKAVYSFILSYLNDPSMSEDIMQETFLRLFTKPRTMYEDDNGLAYILTIARNLSLTYIKRSKKMQVSSDTDLEVLGGGSLGAVERGAEFKDFLSKLSPEERQVVILKEYYGFTYEEIRKIMKLSIATVKRRMESAKEKFKLYDT